MANVERGGRYRIVNAKSGTVLDLSASNNEFGKLLPSSLYHLPITEMHIR